MLETVVQQDEVDVGVDAQQLADALAPLFTHGQGNEATILAVNLVGLITDIARRHVVAGQDKALGLALVATAQHRHMVAVVEFLDDIFHVRGLARAAHGDVTHRDNRHVKLLLWQQAHVKRRVA